MVDTPKKVQEAFDELKSIYGQGLEIKIVDNKFYIFYIDDNDKSSEAYIGWITANGIVMLADSKNPSFDSKEIKVRNERLKAKNISNNTTSKGDINLLKVMSMNSRLTLNRISEITGISIHALEYRIERLERILGIKYTLELNINNLGFSEYIIFAKLISEKPNLNKVKEVLEKNPRIQLALATKGIYDLVIFCVAENNNVVAEVLDNIRNSEILNDIEAEWYITPIAGSYGFIPLRKEFFDILKERVWQRKKKGEHPNLSSLMYREYVLLRELNEDSRKSFSSIDKKYNLPAGSAKRAYKDLTNEDGKNVIIRPTLTIKEIDKKYDMAVIAVLINYTRFMKFRDEHHKYIINEPDNFIDRFSYICDWRYRMAYFTFSLY